MIKWRPDVEALERGESPYGRDGLEEGFPAPPAALLLVRAFLAFGDRAGALLWAAFKIALAWWMVRSAERLAGGWPEWGRVVVLLLALRVLLSDVSHGNTNIVVGATVVAAAVAWSRERPWTSGLWIGVGAVLKITPALFVVYFAWKRSGRALAGVAVGALLLGVAVPAAALGWDRNVELVRDYRAQMIAPYVGGGAPTVVQTEHINQSLFGVGARLLTDSVAIRAKPPKWPEDVRINVASLGPDAFRSVHGLACVLVVALWWAATRRGGGSGAPHVLGEWALGAMAMVQLSERSWKHHYVLTFLAYGFLVATIARARPGSAERRVAWSALGLSAALFGLTGSGVLGDRGSDLAEAWGAHLAGGLALTAGCAALLLRSRGRRPDPGE